MNSFATQCSLSGFFGHTTLYCAVLRRTEQGDVWPSWFSAWDGYWRIESTLKCFGALESQLYFSDSSVSRAVRTSRSWAGWLAHFAPVKGSSDLFPTHEFLRVGMFQAAVWPSVRCIWPSHLLARAGFRRSPSAWVETFAHLGVEQLECICLAPTLTEMAFIVFALS